MKMKKGKKKESHEDPTSVSAPNASSTVISQLNMNAQK